ncbi:MAG: DinB family protein [Bacteroidia bacterium]
MTFTLNKQLEILEKTPEVISILLYDLSNDWTMSNEGGNTWTAKEVVAHLIDCEKTNWIPRVRIVLSDKRDKTFIGINMTAHFEISKNNSLHDMLNQFKHLRKNGIEELKAYNLQEKDFEKTANHPAIGEVNLQQLISTWTSHDLTHIAQIARVIAKQNKPLVGRFIEYLNILK